MQGLRRCRPLALGGVHLELSTLSSSPLSIDMEETVESRIDRLVSENPVIIFTRSGCCMCHVMKRLLSTIGVHPTVIELEEDEISVLPSAAAPAVFIGGSRIGGLESLFAMHLSGHLVSKLVEVGALSNRSSSSSSSSSVL